MKKVVKVLAVVGAAGVMLKAVGKFTDGFKEGVKEAKEKDTKKKG